MGIFTGLGSAIIGGLGSLIGRKNASDDQWNLQKDAQDFNSREAEKQRQFNAREAELARQWQEDFYTQYQSPSAMMSQYRDAGINPVMVAGQGAGSPPSASSASSSAASSGIASAPGAANVIESIMGMMKLKSEIDNINADTESKKASAGLANAQVSLTYGQLSKMASEVSLNAELAKTEKAKQSLYAADAVLKRDEHLLFDRKAEQFDLQNFLLKWEKEYISRYHHKPDQPALNILLDKLKPFTDVGEVFINDLGSVSGKGYNLLKAIFGNLF